MTQRQEAEAGGHDAGGFEGGACRADVWLWRARFFKTRSLAARFVEEGRVRLTRAGVESRLDKPARNVRIGDGLVFAVGGKLTAVRVEGLGERRGPASEARRLYSPLQIS
jgi:ribosome-associated heat shock protein Hsp15